MTKLMNQVKQWWWIVALIFTAAGAWYTQGADIGMIKTKVDKHETDIRDVLLFCAKQTVINENMGKMDKKIDRLLLRR